MNVLVLGGYGLIGAVACRHLVEAGHNVTGLGRDTSKATLQMPMVRWISADLNQLQTPARWKTILESAAPNAIVNCSGALQDGARDRLETVQFIALAALYDACADNRELQYIQISAGRSSPDANTAFMRTKGKADTALQNSSLQWTILRPGLVLSPQAHGGTALLRALAAMPLALPVAFAERRVQTVCVDDVANAIVKSLAGRVPAKTIYDLVEDESHTLIDVLRKMRAWLGLTPAPVLHVPEWLVRTAARFADALGWLGWRSPMRSTAITELSAGVTGDPKPWHQASGSSLMSLDASLAAIPATVQERWFARLFFLKPLIIGTLAAFWLVTGIITLLNPADALAVLTRNNVGAEAASAMVYGGAAVDLALGLAVLIRRWLIPAALGMMAVTIAYLAGGTWFAPELWADPLGPLIKPIPAMVLALTALALAQER